MQALDCFLKVSIMGNLLTEVGRAFHILELWKKKEPLAKEESKSTLDTWLVIDLVSIFSDSPSIPKSCLKWYLGNWFF